MVIDKKNWKTWVVKCNLGLTNYEAFNRVDSWGRTIIGKMPQTLCSFYQTFIVCLLIQIINWPALILVIFSKNFRKDPAEYYIGGMVGHPLAMGIIQTLGLVIGIAFLKENFGVEPELSTMILSISIGIIIMVICFLGVAIIIIDILYVCKFLNNVYLKYKKVVITHDKTKKEKQSFLYLSWQWFKAKKEKVCPIIEYKG